ncbi:hypothetical protein C4D60_Mb06t07600 [Musa balbisiana]|uniref:Uncharacterized protein n=1 Tax=Musa balbisiana TaxID=52838 RepID=A0A4S8INT2_MUSBA|nr:hypothetical protein C4D60_Mb06t07600 [Musa balbisiana]
MHVESPIASFYIYALLLRVRAAKEIMKHELSLLILLPPLLFLVASSLPHLIHGVEFQPTVVAGCNGTIAECSAATTELLMDSEIHRRFLQPKNTITYPVLKANNPVCSVVGKPYTTNCIKPRSPNPPNRGCTPIYGCRQPQSSPVSALH